LRRLRRFGGGQSIPVEIILDGEVIARGMEDLSSDGRLRIHAKGV